MQVIDTEKFEVLCVSPRNHFIFTPMLPSSAGEAGCSHPVMLQLHFLNSCQSCHVMHFLVHAVGTVEFRSLLEPIRISNPFVTYIEAECEVRCSLIGPL